MVKRLNGYGMTNSNLIDLHNPHALERLTYQNIHQQTWLLLLRVHVRMLVSSLSSEGCGRYMCQQARKP